MWRALLALALAVLVGGPTTSGASAPQVPTFVATLHLAGPGDRSDVVSIAVAHGATSGYDRGIDALAPPPPPGGAWAQAYATSEGGERLRKSALPPASEVSWTIRLDASGPAGDLVLSWDPREFAALPGFDVTISTANVTRELPEDSALGVPKDEGLATAFVTVRIGPPVGGPPSPPQDLTADLGHALGEVALAWHAPASDGGHALRRYVIERADGAGAFMGIGSTRALAFVDEHADLGHVYAYRVLAVSHAGASAPSGTALMLGTGKPDATRPRDEDEATIAAREVPLDVGTPAVDADLLAVHVGPTVEDDRQLGVDARVAGEEHSAAVFTGVPVPAQEDAALAHVAASQVAREDAHVELASARSGHVARWSIEGSVVTFRDATLLP